jgi:hypothetical protein
MVQPVLLLIGLLLSLAARTQVPVSEEPRHHKLLANEWVRVLDVHIPPHDTTLTHKHSTPSVFIVLSSTRTGSQVLIEPRKATFAAGNIWFESFQDTPRIHRVWNADTVEFHVMDIELPHAPISAGNATDPPFSKLLFDAKPVRAYRLTLPPGQHQALPRSPSPVLVVGLSGPEAYSDVNHHTFTQKGDYLFLAADTPLLITNNSARSQHQFALLYLK